LFDLPFCGTEIRYGSAQAYAGHGTDTSSNTPPLAPTGRH
jgi:hypothetical protein